MWAKVIPPFGKNFKERHYIVRDINNKSYQKGGNEHGNKTTPEEKFNS